jgi:hypothetical protein
MDASDKLVLLNFFGALVTPSNLVRYYLLLSLQTAGRVVASLD